MNRSLVTRCLSLLLALWLPATGFATSLQMIALSPGAGATQTAHGDCFGHADQGRDHSSARHHHHSKNHSSARAGNVEFDAHANVDATADAMPAASLTANAAAGVAAAGHCLGADADRLSHGQCTFCQVSVSLVAFEPRAPRDVHSSHVLIPRRAVLRLSADTDPPLRPPSPLSP